MSDEFIDRLRANDPASAEVPDLTAIKAKVDAHTADNVVTFTPRRQFNRGLRIAAAVGALALAGGAGFAGGSWRTSADNDTAVRTTELPTTSAEGGRASAPAVGGGADAKVASNYMGGYWGNVILKAGSSIPNAAGAAKAYRFSADGIDAEALAKALAKAVGITDTAIKRDGNGITISDDKGGYNVFVGDDAMRWFGAYNNAASPWNCGIDGGQGREPSEAEANATQAKCDAEWTTPTKADAIAAAKRIVADLGLDLADGARFSAYSYNTRMMTVVMSPVVDGMQVGTTWQVEVSKDGAFSVNGYAAKIVAAVDYPTVGARDAAARSELRKWQAFGPQQVWNPEDQGMTTAREGAAAAPTTPTKDGKPMLQGYVSEASVTSATRSLMQVWLADGSSMLMPAWNYAVSGGGVWQMLAISEDYIDWQAQPMDGPIAYAADAGAMAK